MSFNLLCIDDEPAVLGVRKMLLESKGYGVLLAQSGPEGLSILQREPIHTVILDYSMPGMTGAEVAERIRELRPAMPIIMLSACVGLPDSELKDIDAYITKGEAPDVLLRTILSVQPRSVSNAG
jgi:CheY-like chemotaxis protein